MENNVGNNELLKEINALKAQVEAMREQLQIAHDCITCADETGYVQDVGFVDLETVALELKLAIEATPQQCLRKVLEEAYEWGCHDGYHGTENFDRYFSDWQGGA